MHPQQNEIARADRFLVRLAGLQTSAWLAIHQAPVDAGTRDGAMDVVFTSHCTAGRCPRRDYEDYLARAQPDIEALGLLEAVRAAVSRLPGQEQTRELLHSVRDATAALLVATMADFEIGDRSYSPQTAARTIYGPFEAHIPLAGIL